MSLVEIHRHGEIEDSIFEALARAADQIYKRNGVPASVKVELEQIAPRKYAIEGKIRSSGDPEARTTLYLKWVPKDQKVMDQIALELFQVTKELLKVADPEKIRVVGAPLDPKQIWKGEDLAKAAAALKPA